MFSFENVGDLKACSVFHLDFERGANRQELSRVWLATSRGLREYDGYSWRQHGTAQGLPSDFVRCVLVTREGVLWVGTDRGAGIYDGRSFRTMGSETNLAGPSVRRMIEDRDGTIWFCSDPWPSSARSGGLTSWQGGRWRAYRVSDGLPSEYVVNYFRDSSDRQWAVTREALVRWNGTRWVTALTPPPNQDGFQSGCLAEVPGRPLLFSSGVAVFELYGDEWRQHSDSTLHQFGVCATADGKIYGNRWISEGRRAIAEWTDAGWVNRSAVFELAAPYGEDLREDPDGNVWLVGYETLRLWRRNGQWNRFSGVPPPRLIDGAGEPWFSRDWDGMVRPLVPVRFREGQFENMEIACDDLFADAAGAVWGSMENRVTRWARGGVTHFYEGETGLTDIRAARFGPGSGYWVLGRDARGQLTVTRWNDGRWVSRSLPEVQGDYLETSLAVGPDGVWFVAQTPEKESFAVHATTTAPVQQVPIPGSLLSQYALRMHAGAGGTDVWLYGDSGLIHWKQPAGPWQTVTNLPGRAIVRVLERDEELWVACSGRTGGHDGLARLDRSGWSSYPLASVLNMALQPDGCLLIGGRGVLAKVEPGPNAEPEEMVLPESIRLLGAIRDRSGSIWMGNAEVGYRFTPDRVPPETRIDNVVTNVLHGEDLELRVSALERFRPEYRGDYTYSWQLDGGPWSPPRSAPTHRYSAAELQVGLHEVSVRARDAGGDVDPTPAIMTFRVHPLPLQDHPWFGAAVLGVMGLLGLSVLVAVRSRIRLAGYARELEEKVEKRTSALVADLTQRRRAEAALRESEERYRGLIEVNPEAVFVNDQNRIVFINAAGLELFGAELPEQLLGRNPLELFHPDCHEAIRRRIGQMLESPRRVPLLEEKVVRLDGVVRDVEVVAVSLEERGRTVIQVVLRDVTERKRAETERQRLLTELLQAEDEERRRIGRELHDSTAQHIAAAKLNILELRTRAAPLPAITPLMDDTRDLLEQSLQELRTFSWWLHPPLLDELGLADALQDYAAGFARRSCLQVKVNVSKFHGRLPREVEMALFRVAQECLTNVHRHSASATALIRLERDGHEVRLEVQDSGCGLAPDAMGAGAGVGLRGMRERLRQFGGQLAIESDSEGTTVLASLPLASEKDA